MLRTSGLVDDVLFSYDGPYVGGVRNATAVSSLQYVLYMA